MDCLVCGNPTSNPKFCSKSCAVTHNNKTSPKRQRLRSCASCPTQVISGRKYCPECFTKYRLIDYATVTLDKYRMQVGSKNSYQTCVRVHARKVAKQAGLLNACRVCGYSTKVECCHIKPVASFPKDALLIDVNSVDNLIGLCPTHHWELDNGHLQLPTESIPV